MPQMELGECPFVDNRVELALGTRVRTVLMPSVLRSPLLLGGLAQEYPVIDRATLAQCPTPLQYARILAPLKMTEFHA